MGRKGEGKTLSADRIFYGCQRARFSSATALRARLLVGPERIAGEAGFRRVCRTRISEFSPAGTAERCPGLNRGLFPAVPTGLFNGDSQPRTTSWAKFSKVQSSLRDWFQYSPGLSLVPHGLSIAAVREINLDKAEVQPSLRDSISVMAVLTHPLQPSGGYHKSAYLRRFGSTKNSLTHTLKAPDGQFSAPKYLSGENSETEKLRARSRRFNPCCVKLFFPWLPWRRIGMTPLR